MTEMIEVSNILNNATSQSFIIFDELGRGTSTYDGLALTSAILQYVLKHVKAKTLIATHYHELIKLEKMYPEVTQDPFQHWRGILMFRARLHTRS